MRGDGVEHLAGRIAGGEALGVGGENRKLRIPVRRQFAPLHALDLVGEIGILRVDRLELRQPASCRLLAAPAEPRGNARARRPAPETWRPPASHSSFGQPNFFFAERLAVGGAGVLLVRRAVADMAVDDDQRRRVVGPAEISIACANRS